MTPLLQTVLVLGVIGTALQGTVAGPVAKSAMTSQNLFADELFSVLVAERPAENVVYSPASIQTCLAFAYIGAGGNTAAEMRTVAKLGEGDKRQVAQNYGDFLKTSFKSPKADGPTLKTANRIYVNENYKIDEDFNKISGEFFEAQAENMNFKNSEDAINRINTWVEQQTENKIKDLLKPGAVDGNTKAVLVNAIYFKGKWLNPFSEASTHKVNFQMSQHQQVLVDMMSQTTRSFNYVELPEYNAKALEMPYMNSDLSMLLILPNEVEGLKNMETKLKGVDLNAITSKMSMQQVHVFVPKFRIEFDINLKEPLQKMGLTSMFSNSANFSHILEDASRLKISAAKHKAFLDVNEAGSEAAAATFFEAVSYSRSMTQAATFLADHPFVFAIRSKTAVYFAGHVAKF